MSWRVTAVQAAMAGATCENAVAVHGTGTEEDGTDEVVTVSELLTEADVLLEMARKCQFCR